MTWAGDITYIPTAEGWLYLSTVLDLYSRRVIGWGLADHLRTELASAALQMAVATRGGMIDQVVFHSDSEYVGAGFRAEAFFATFKRELVHRFRFATRAEARRVIVAWIEGWSRPAGCIPPLAISPQREGGCLLA